MTRMQRLVHFLRSAIDRDYRDYRYLCRSRSLLDVGYFRWTAGLGDFGKHDPVWLYIQTERTARISLRIAGTEWRQLVSPHPLFDLFYYLARYFPDGLAGNAFAHYLREGWREGLWPSPYFDPETYRRRSDWTEAAGDPLQHYTSQGARDGISPSPFFDINFYLDKIPPLNEYRRQIIRHYKFYEAKEGKSPLPVFDPVWYLNSRPDNESASRDPLAHYLTGSINDQRRPSAWFDPQFYARLVDGISGGSAALAHYLSEGVFRGCYTDARVAALPAKPTISVLVPVYNPAPHFLNNCIRSVLYQVYPHWQLCLVDDCSDDPDIRRILLDWAARDDRIRVAFHQENRGIAAATNSAAELAGGEFLGFLDNDDELAPECLFHVAEALNTTGAQVIYTDEDLIGDDGSRHAVFRKPDFNPELLLSHNYITHFVVLSADLFERLGGMDSRFDGAQDYELALRLTRASGNVHHIAEVCYHWRAIATSTSIGHSEKPYAHEAGRAALAEHLGAAGVEAAVGDTDLAYHYRITLHNRSLPAVAVFIYTDQPAHVDRRVAWLRERTVYPECAVFPIVSADRAADNETKPAAVDAGPVKTKLINDALQRCDAEYVALLADGADGLNDEWLTELVDALHLGASARIACGRTGYGGGDGPSYTIANLDDMTPSYFASFLGAASRHQHGLHNLQAVTCCDWQICLLDRRLLDDLNGFDAARFPYLMAMLDFSLRAAESGSRIVYTPHGRVEYDRPPDHAGLEAAALAAEKERFQRRWAHWLRGFDPYYNVGQAAASGIDPDRFRQWLVGGGAQTKP